jgi:hypothetical protein
MNGKPGSKRPGRVPRTSAGRIVAAISLAAALVAAGLPATRGAEAQAKPSIVLVLADNMPTSLVAATPNLRSLVAQGATFTAANDQRPLCGPACAALLTGRYAQNSGVATNSHADRCGRGSWLKCSPGSSARGRPRGAWAAGSPDLHRRANAQRPALLPRGHGRNEPARPDFGNGLLDEALEDAGDTENQDKQAGDGP